MTKSRIKIEEGATVAYSFTNSGAKIFPSWSPREWHSACFVFENETMTTFIDKDEIAKAKYGHFKVCQNYSEVYFDIWQRLKECLMKPQNDIKNFNKPQSKNWTCPSSCIAHQVPILGPPLSHRSHSVYQFHYIIVKPYSPIPNPGDWG